ncbi:ribonuclease III [Lindgomyces ingoldianus]|uniref:Ribonuclease III n=1 Tax=Lindgomyces ingoldianus TaxID=673940 RepID=A0ACB6R7K5_9PLEO|nr:ribonuclease III [Lindgomyces ingoldianus]KAF2475293.1 ribonuclease III [Lindgomyces ingoldianus]
MSNSSIAIFPNTAAKLAHCEYITGHTFTSKRLGLEALQMAGGPLGTDGIVEYCGTYLPVPKNKRLAIIGDATLDHVLSLIWYHTGRAKKDWTTFREQVVSNSALNTRGRALDLDKCILPNVPGDVISVEMLATTLEAVIGAVRCDGGDEAAERAMRNMGFMEHEMLLSSTKSSM